MENLLQVEQFIGVIEPIQSLPSSQDRKQQHLTIQTLMKKSPHVNVETNTSVNMKTTNYKSFLAESKKNVQYPIPSSFQLISIKEKSSNQVYDYQNLNFPILSYTFEQICTISSQIILNNGFYTICQHAEINDLMKLFCENYKPVAYHNFSHGFSLMHMLYQLFKLDKNFKEMFSIEEIGYTLIAAIGHDLNHPGTNNAYEVKLGSSLAKQAENMSVLEKMHIKKMFELIKLQNYNIFKKSTNPQKIKELMVRCILSTDISKHFENLSKLQGILSKTDKNFSQNQRYFCMEQAFHACDIGNPCLDYQEYINWAALVSYQFNTQTIMEAERQIEVTQMFKYKGLKAFYQSQIGFSKFLVLPLWKELSLSWSGLTLLVQNIQTNLKILQNKADTQVQQN